MLPQLGMEAFALQPWPEDCYVASDGACLMDAASRVVCFEKRSDEAFYPASITKVLTALIVIENCESLSETVEFSYDAVHIEEENSTIIGASEGDRLSVLDCLYSLLFQSANEVANALAEHVGAKHPELKQEGDDNRRVFVRMMNTRAEELGCRGSHFNNPSGLTDPEHYTTPYDMCRIMAAAVENPVFTDIESRTYWTHAPIRRYPDAEDPWNTVYQKHSMLKKNNTQYYEGTIAGKTGYTQIAGNTLVTACRRDGMTLVACVMNAHSNHYNDTRRLFDFGFAHFRSLCPADYDDLDRKVASDFTVDGLPVIDSYTLGMDAQKRITVPAEGIYEEVRKQFTLVEDEPGVFGRLTYYYGDREVGSNDVRLVRLGGMKEMQEASEDPMLASYMSQAASEEESAETASGEAETSADGSAAAGAGSGAASGGSSAGASGTGDSGAESSAAVSAEKSAEARAKRTGLVRILLIAVLVFTASVLVLSLRGNRRPERSARAERSGRGRGRKRTYRE